MPEIKKAEPDDMGSAVNFTCLCPGPTDTNFFSRVDMENTYVVKHKDQLMLPPEEVAKGAYEALKTFIRRAIPKSLQSRLQKKFYETNED